MSPSVVPAFKARLTDRPRVVPLFSWLYWLFTGVAAVTVTACVCTAFVPGVLRGTEVMNGSARGTALVLMFVAVPLLVASAALVGAGGARPVITWLEADAYILCTAVLFLFIRR